MSKKIIAAILIAISAASSTSAFAGKLAVPNAGPAVATKAQLGIINPITNACPAKAKLAIWIFTNKPGPVNYMIAKKGGAVSGPYTIQSKKGGNGLSMASYTKTYDIHQPFNAQYRVLVSGTNGKVMSNWVTMKASCKIMLGG